MDRLYLFAEIAETPVALRAEDVEAVVRLGALSPAPRAAPHIIGLTALRSRVLTVIDPAQRVTGQSAPITANQLAIVVNIAGHSYAMLVDRVSDIAMVEGGERPVRGRLASGWKPFVGAVIEQDERINLLVDPALFVERAAEEAA